MANRKISEFTALTAPASGDTFAILDVDASGIEVNKKITYANVLGKAPDGSASAPAFSFSSDTNSGISGGSDTLVLSTGGTAAISVDSSQNVTLSANLTVSGTTTTIDTTTLTVKDKNIEIAKGNGNDAAVDGAGITIDSTDGDKTWNWVDATDAWTSSEHIHLGDDKKLLVGTGSDLKIYHNGNHSYIQDAGTGNLYIDSIDGNIYIRPNQSEAGISVIENGAVKLAYDNSPKLETTSAGIEVSGSYYGEISSNTAYSNTASSSTVLDLRNTNTSANTNSVGIKLATSGNGFGVVNINACNNSTNASADLKIQTRHSGTLATNFIVTSDGNIQIPNDSKQLQLGASQDLQIFHNGTDSVIYNATGDLDLRSNGTISLQASDGSEIYGNFVKDAEVSLYFDSSKKLETTSAGVTVTGALTATSFVGALTGNVTGNAATATEATNVTVSANNSTDETVYPVFVDGATGTQGAETDTGLTYNPSTGLLTSTGFSGSGASLTTLNASNLSSGTVNVARLGSGSSVTTKFLRGDNTWQTVSGTPEGTAILSTGESGASKYLREDGDGTCSWQAVPAAVGGASGVDFNDNVKARWGTGNDLEIYHSSSDNNSYIQHTQNGTSLIVKSDYFIVAENQSTDFVIRAAAGTAELYYDNSKKAETYASGFLIHQEAQVKGAEANDANIYMYADEGDDHADKWKLNAAAAGGFYLENAASGSWEVNFKTTGNGGTELYYDNSKKLETESWGVTVTGSYNGTSHIRTVSDSGKITAGASNDLEMYHDGSHSRINAADGGDGRLIISGRDGSAGDIGLQLNAEDSEESIFCKVDGAVELFYDASKKFETTSTGTTVTGVATVSNGIVETAITIATNHTITTNYNAMSAGPVTVSATVTVPSGSVWTVI